MNRNVAQPIHGECPRPNQGLGHLPLMRCWHGLALKREEIPRLCRGGSRTLRIPGVCFLSNCRAAAVKTAVRGFCFCSCFCFGPLRKGPFEGPATVKPPALPVDTYSTRSGSKMVCRASGKAVAKASHDLSFVTRAREASQHKV